MAKKNNVTSGSNSNSSKNKKEKGKIRTILSNKWVKFGIVSAIYLLLVIWMRNYWFLLGLPIIFDIYISKKVKWAFWKKKYEKGEKRNTLLDWVDAAIFALIAATLIRLFFIEAFVIPSGSMEKTMLVGDYLFVSKVSYGPKMPNTPIAFPLVHNTMPFSSTAKSFTTVVERPYKRLAGFGHVERGDIVVFNFPHGDTVALSFPNSDYYELTRLYGKQFVLQQSKLVVRPVDRRDNYVKRCVATPGDTMQIIHGDVYVNGTKEDRIPDKLYSYYVQTNGRAINPVELERMDLTSEDWTFSPQASVYEMLLTDENVEKIKSFANVINVVKIEGVDTLASYQRMFPHNPSYAWTEDNYGPLWVPEKGATVELTMQNLPLYRRIIDVYEENDLEVKDGGIYINGELATRYTFRMNYFFMMGDNRHRSLDSRYWGFVPEDHVVGKPWFIWFSSEAGKSFPGNIRWSRIFKGVK